MDFRWQRIGNVTITVSLLCAARLSDSILPPFSLLSLCLLFYIFFFLSVIFLWNISIWIESSSFRSQKTTSWLTGRLTDWKDLDPDSPIWVIWCARVRYLTFKEPLSPPSLLPLRGALTRLQGQLTHLYSVWQASGEAAHPERGWTTEIIGVAKIYLPYSEQDRAIVTYKKLLK